MPSDSSQTNSGAAARFFSAESGSTTPSSAAIPPEKNGTGDEPQHGHAPRHQAGPVHQPAEDEPVPDADNEARAQQERPVMECDQRLADRHQRARIRAGGSGDVGPQRQDREEADDADGDEGALDEPGGDVAEGERFVLPLEDGEQHHGGADVGDDEQDLEERAQGNAPIGAGPQDEVGVVQHRVVEHERRWDRGEEGDDEQHAGNTCRPVRCVHVDSLPSWDP